MPQMIFVNLETGDQYLFPKGFVFPHLPREGESVMVFKDGSDDEVTIEGVVEKVSWSIGPDPEGKDDYSVFFDIYTYKDNKESL